jgi:peptidoglycan hydrolase-like protein with peptidoglycan-binding domain
VKRWINFFLLLVLLVMTLALLRDYILPESHVCQYNRKLYPCNPPLAGADVEELQLRLRELGFYGGEINGIYDEDTVLAVEEAQLALELEPTGEAELSFWPLLYHAEAETQGVNTQPPPGKVHLEIYLHKLKLVLFSDGEEYASFPIAAGFPATPSPMGEWRVTDKNYRPNDAFGTRWMRLSVPWGGYGVHGTNAPWSVGRVASLGCIRMYNKDVELIYPWIPVGTKIRITGDYQVKFRLPMSKGQVGQDVVLVQWALRSVGFCPGEAGGVFDQETEAAVKALQRFFGLEPSGVIDETVFQLINRGEGKEWPPK